MQRKAATPTRKANGRKQLFSGGAIAAVTAQADTTVQGTHTKIDKMDVPESAAQPVNLVVNGATIKQISTNTETSISGNGTVDTVIAKA